MNAIMKTCRPRPKKQQLKSIDDFEYLYQNELRSMPEIPENSELVRCGPCGYVMRADKLEDVCPVCALPREVFKPYREKVSSRRLFLLNFDLHPIAIHFSQAWVGCIPLLAAITYIFPNFFYNELLTVIAFLVVTLPGTMVLGMVTGMLDGFIRFKTFDTPFMVQKLVLSALIIVISSAPSLYVLGRGLSKDTMLIVLLLEFGSLGFAVRLGLLGKQLLNVILPGKIFFRKDTKKKKNIKALARFPRRQNDEVIFNYEMELGKRKDLPSKDSKQV